MAADAVLRPPYGSRPENRFLAVLGPSGSGKSSLRWPAWSRRSSAASSAMERLAGSDLPSRLRPARKPGRSTRVDDGRDPGLGALRDLIAGLKDDQRPSPSVRMALRDGPATQRLVVLVDQFEEAFTLCQDTERRQALFDNLLYAANIAGGQTVVVFTLRARLPRQVCPAIQASPRRCQVIRYWSARCPGTNCTARSSGRLSSRAASWKPA